MWTGTVSVDELRRRDMWRPESFSNEDSRKRPTAFELVPLQRVVKEHRETMNPQDYPDQEFYYVGLENVQSLTGDIVGKLRTTGRQIRSTSKIFRRNDILYGRLRPNLNKVYLAEPPVDNGICSSEFCVLAPRLDVIKPRFLREILASSFVQDYVASLQTGSALPRIHLEELLQIEIPLPPLSKQVELERFLEVQHTKRKELANQLSALPIRIHEGLMAAIESDMHPTLNETRLEEEAPTTNAPRVVKKKAGQVRLPI